MYRYYITLHIITSLLVSQYNISGFIYDSKSGESLPGANIFLENTNYGTTSDLDGYFIILDIPLLLENKINNKKDILIYVESKKSMIQKKLTKRKNFNQKILKKFKSIQFPINYKKKKSQYILKNDFTEKTIKIGINNILKKIVYK